MKSASHKANSKRSPVPPKSTVPSSGGKRKSPPKKEQSHARALEGEGSYRATRDYNRHLQRDLKTRDVDKSAARARQALRSAEAVELREAEELGKRGPQSEPENEDSQPPVK